MMNENNSFALKSPNTKKYKSISQNDEDSISANNNNNNNNVSEKQYSKLEMFAPKSVSLGISIDENGIDKRDESNNNIFLSIINDAIDDDNQSSKTDSDDSIGNLINNNGCDSDATYNSFKIDNEQTNNLNILNSNDLGDLNSSDSVIFWLFTLKRMNIINIATIQKKFLQTIMSLNMVSVIIYTAFIYEYNIESIFDSFEYGNKYEILFSLFINSGIIMAIITGYINNNKSNIINQSIIEEDIDDNFMFENDCNNINIIFEKEENQNNNNSYYSYRRYY